MVRYQTLDRKRALEVLTALRRGDTAILEQAVRLRGHGEAIEADVERLILELRELKSHYPEKLPIRSPLGGDFEARACEVVHQCVPGDPVLVADVEFWLWLAIVKCREFIDWRFGGGAGDNLKNFGIGSSRENMLYRLWLRADIGYDPDASDPYHIAKLGDQDFWRSHILRQSYACNRQLARALVEFQFRGGAGQPRLNTAEMRALAKNLKRGSYLMLYTTLTQGDAIELLERLSRTPTVESGA